MNWLSIKKVRTTELKAFNTLSLFTLLYRWKQNMSPTMKVEIGEHRGQACPPHFANLYVNCPLVVLKSYPFLLARVHPKCMCSLLLECFLRPYLNLYVLLVPFSIANGNKNLARVKLLHSKTRPLS